MTATTRRPSWAVPLIALALLAATFVVGTGTRPLVTGGPSTGSAPPPPRPSGTGGSRPVKQRDVFAFPVTRVIEIVGYVALILFLLTIVALLLNAAVAARRERVKRLGDPDLDPGSVDALLTPPALVAGGRRGLASLREGLPRNAIVACWLALEGACADSGLLRDPAETPTEFARRVLAHYRADAEATRTLAGLYLEARFSSHAMTERDRVLAVEALEQMLADLVSRSGEPAAPAPGAS